MTNEIAVIKVRLETNKYMKTVMDRRLSFADKLAAFGMEYSPINVVLNDLEVHIFNIFL